MREQHGPKLFRTREDEKSERVMRRFREFGVLFISLFVCITTVPLSAEPVIPYVTATIDATYISEDPFDGFYRYDLSLQWDLNGTGAGLSHWDILFNYDCGLTDTSFVQPAGYSTSEGDPENETLGWTGFWLDEGDPNFSNHPAIKFNSPFFPPGTTDEPGEEGHGTFTFYSRVVPAPYDTYIGALGAKTGAGDIFGDLTGYAVPCTVPEPATLLLLGLGGLALLRKRRQ